MDVNVTATAAEAFDQSKTDAFFNVIFENSNEFSYAENSTIYYYVELTDSTPTTPLTRNVTFAIEETTAGTVAAATSEPFTFENTTNLVSPLTASNGRILYQKPA